MPPPQEISFDFAAAASCEIQFEADPGTRSVNEVMVLLSPGNHRRRFTVPGSHQLGFLESGEYELEIYLVTDSYSNRMLLTERMVDLAPVLSDTSVKVQPLSAAEPSLRHNTLGWRLPPKSFTTYKSRSPSLS